METPISFSNLPYDIQLNIISFLRPIDISSLSCTCSYISSLCNPSSPSLWHALCDRRWGTLTNLQYWSATPSHRLYKTLDRFENLIGFWFHMGESPTLVLFQWFPSSITGFKILPSPAVGSYSVRKIPFLRLGLSAGGEILSYLHPDVIPVTVILKGCSHLVVEKSRSFCVEIAIPGVERCSRRGRRKKVERVVIADHYFKISNYFPTPKRPLQGLWKGITEDMSLEFYLVTHDNDVGGIICQRVGDSAELFPVYSPVFWTSNTILLVPHFSKEEHDEFIRDYIWSVESIRCNIHKKIFSCTLCINCSYDLDMAGSFGDPTNVEGRIWVCEDETFGFGSLRNNVIVDLKRIALDDYILGEVESSH